MGLKNLNISFDSLNIGLLVPVQVSGPRSSTDVKVDVKLS
jgi:hypothetical protein